MVVVRKFLRRLTNYVYDPFFAFSLSLLCSHRVMDGFFDRDLNLPGRPQ
jgi:hypothetical protein